MTKILITSGPTRQYLDPVRYISNGSSGRMGAALAQASLDFGHQVVVVSGPVGVDYPREVEVIPVLSTEEMLAACQATFPKCDGVIGAAAPCDYRPEIVASEKMSKTGEPIVLSLVETTDVIATLGAAKRENQWVVGFALETNDRRFRAMKKLEAKCCDLMILNGPEAMDSKTNRVEVLSPSGEVVERLGGAKQTVATGVLRAIQYNLIDRDDRFRSPSSQTDAL
jgi:phosphopantothenoylcysteine decarboxylase/phosphopantothenate--cysteine ligase